MAMTRYYVTRAGAGIGPGAGQSSKAWPQGLYKDSLRKRLGHAKARGRRKGISSRRLLLNLRSRPCLFRKVSSRHGLRVLVG